MKNLNESQTVDLGVFHTLKSGSNYSIANLNRKIKEYIENIYGRYGFVYGGLNVDININGLIINTEYISKMVNNYTIFRSIVRSNGIRDEESFYNFMFQNLSNIYNFSGEYFNNTLNILINTTRKGNIEEKNSIEFFESILSSKGIDIKVDSPTIKEDIAGIDGKFIWNGKTITIQVKPYSSTHIIGDIIKIESIGSLSLSTDYLVLYNKGSYIITKGKDTTIEGKYFMCNISKVIKNPT